MTLDELREQLNAPGLTRAAVRRLRAELELLQQPTAEVEALPIPGQVATNQPPEQRPQVDEGKS